MRGWWNLWKWGGGGRCGEVSEEATWPHDQHSRRWYQRPPVLRQSSQPSALAVTSRTWLRWVHTGIGKISVRRPRESRTIRGSDRPSHRPDHDLPRLGGRGHRDGHDRAWRGGYAR